MESREVPDGLLAGQRVLVVWHRAHIAEVIQPVLEGLRERAGRGGGQVVIEHAERLTLGEGDLTRQAPGCCTCTLACCTRTTSCCSVFLNSIRAPISLVPRVPLIPTLFAYSLACDPHFFVFFLNFFYSLQ